MSNFTDVTFSIPKLSDRQIIQGMQRAFDATSIKGEQLELITLAGGSPLTCPIGAAEQDTAISRYLNLDGMLIRNFSVAFYQSRAHVRLSRQNDALTDTCHVVLSPLKNHPNARPAQSLPDPLEPSQLIVALRNELHAVSPLDAKTILGEETAKHYAHRENELARLQATLIEVTKRFTEGAAEHARTLREELRADREELTKEFDSKRATESQRFEARESDLKAREDQLSQQLAELDDRAARHARRKIREDLKTELSIRATTFELTKGTQSLREPIAWATWSLMALFAALFAFSSGMSIWNNDYSLPALAKQLVLAAALASTTAFYLRWQNRWFEQHAQEEFRLKRMALDVDRASWVVEMAMEWKEDKGTELPKELLDRLSTHLFENTEQTHEELNPADQLASALFGSAARLKLAMPGGTEAEFDRRSKRKLVKQELG